MAHRYRQDWNAADTFGTPMRWYVSALDGSEDDEPATEPPDTVVLSLSIASLNVSVHLTREGAGALMSTLQAALMVNVGLGD